MQEQFRQFAAKISAVTGSIWVFVVALCVIAAWALSGPLFTFSDTWQLIINTGTTIITFLMVFLIQNTQNRDAAALHAKLDELIVHTQGARNEMAAAEEFSEEQLESLRKHFVAIARGGDAGSGVSGAAARPETRSSDEIGRGSNARTARKHEATL